jgi:hypothetical protein
MGMEILRPGRLSPGLKLGAMPPREDLRASLPKLPKRMRATKAPGVLERDGVPFQPLMGENDRFGDCTAVGVANGAEARTALEGYSLGITNQQILDFYGACTGVEPANTAALAAAPGAYEVDVLSRQAASGFVTSSQTLVGAWATVPDPLDFNSSRVLTAQWGFAYLGVALSVADQNTEVWVANPPAEAGDPTPGSWGGHCLLLWAYAGTAEDSLVKLATWGSFQLATWGWLRKALQESHGIAWRQLGTPGLQDLEYESMLEEARQLGLSSS